MKKYIIAFLAGMLVFSLGALAGSAVMRKKVTDGRDYLEDFAPLFAEINDDVLFGKVWSRTDELAPRDRSLITIAAFMGAGITNEGIKAHIQIARDNGVTKGEIAEVITHLAFYTGWPRAWPVFMYAKEVYAIED